jgi:recombination protein RecA
MNDKIETRKKKSKKDERKVKVLAGVEKNFGAGLAEFADAASRKIERLATGVAQIDWLTLGGLPLGKVSLFRGAEGGTKTTMAVIACARYLERFPDRLAVYIDAEEKYPEQFVKRLGIDGSRFVRVAPETAAETIDFMHYTLREKSVGILVLDSIAALLPEIEREEPMENQQQGMAARLVNKAIRKTIGAMRMRRVKSGWSPTVILINQERVKIGVRFGDPSTIPGGEGQKFASSLILKMRALSVKEDDRREWGLPEEHPVVKVATTVVKHSFGPRGKSAEYMLAMDAFGSLKAGEALDHEFVRILALKRGLVGQNGRGSEKIAQEIAERGELYQRLKKELIG